MRYLSYTLLIGVLFLPALGGAGARAQPPAPGQGPVPEDGGVLSDPRLDERRQELDALRVALEAVQDKTEAERLRKQMELQQKQIEVLEKMVRLLAEQAKRAPPAGAAVQELQTQQATLEARSRQAA